MQIVFLILILVIGIADVFSQGRSLSKFEPSDFAGSWTMLPEKSNPGMLSVRDLTEHTMEISLESYEFRIVEIFFVKGKRHVREHGFSANSKNEKRTGGKISTSMANGRIERKWQYKESYGWVEASRTYSLSKDKTILTVEEKHLGQFPSSFEISGKLTFRK